jgi:LmbE family N-acetylglucosaminyl deacetylase
MPYTLVSFHAHPDDEVLLTGGTLAKAAGEGHRVVLVVATDGAAGLASSQFSAGGTLADQRRRELHDSARELGCARVVLLGYPDSGLSVEDDGEDGEDGPTGQDGAEPVFSRLDPELAAARLAAILTEEQADVLTIYDPAGGYGHPDHRQVHVVGVRAAALAGTPVVLEATLDRRPLLWLIRLADLIPGGLGGLRRADFATAFSAPETITHRVNVRAQAPAKRRAMRAHVSQASADSGPRTLSMLLRLPRPVFARLLGREFFVEHGRTTPAPDGDIFATLRTAPIPP